MPSQPEAIEHPLQLDDNIALHRKGWRVQPIGLTIILLIMLAGLLGLFGEGWLSRKTVQQGPVQTSYEKYSRQDGEMILRVAANGIGRHPVIVFPQAYTQAFKIERIEPEPLSQTIRDGRLWYVFAAKPNVQVRFYMQPKRLGSINGGVWAANQYIPLHHFIFP